MGMFLALSGVIGSDADDVASALADFASSRGGSFAPRAGTTDDEGILVLHAAGCNCTVMYPHDFFDWDDASCHVSAKLGKVVFSLHIHDGDLWMFVLFKNGEPVTRFNPIPDYWCDQLAEEELRAWAGDPTKIAAVVPGVTTDMIEPYLRRWDLDDDEPGKAFPDDEFGYNEDWQMCDFMRRIGLPYPLDDSGAVLGKTYEFVVRGAGDAS